MTIQELIEDGQGALFCASAGFAVGMRRQAITSAAEATNLFRRAQDAARLANDLDAQRVVSARLHSVAVLLAEYGYSHPAAPTFEVISPTSG